MPLLPLFLLIALIPIIYRTTIWICSDIVWLNLMLLGCAGLVLLYGVIRVCSLMPSHREPRSPTDSTPTYASDRGIRWGIVYPTLGWTLLIPWLLDLATGPLANATHERPWLAHHAFWIVPAIYFVLMTLSFRLAWWFQSYRLDPGLQLFRANFGRWIAACLGASILTWFILLIAGSVLPLEIPPIQVGDGSPLPPVLIDTATVLTVFAPLALAIVHVLQTSLYVALRQETELADLDREWLGRVNAMILRLAVGWTVFALGCLILPLLVSFVYPSPTHASWSGGRISVMAASSVLVGGAAARLGKIWSSVDTFIEKPGVMDRVRAYLPTVLGALFGIGLLTAFGGVLYFVLAQMQDAVSARLHLGDVAKQPKWLPLVLQAIVMGILLIGVWCFRSVNVNRFSMHAVYRNRLTRAFLGSARSKRYQDPFTGFDPWDNTPLSSLRDTSSSLFPVINMTLNIT